jgi:hypothetical protein
MSERTPPRQAAENKPRHGRREVNRGAVLQKEGLRPAWACLKYCAITALAHEKPKNQVKTSSIGVLQRIPPGFAQHMQSDSGRYAAGRLSIKKLNKTLTQVNVLSANQAKP